MFGVKIAAIGLTLGSAAATTINMPAATPAGQQVKIEARIASESTPCAQQVWPNIASECIRNSGGTARNIRAISLVDLKK